MRAGLLVCLFLMQSVCCWNEGLSDVWWLRGCSGSVSRSHYQGPDTCSWAPFRGGQVPLNVGPRAGIFVLTSDTAPDLDKFFSVRPWMSAGELDGRGGRNLKMGPVCFCCSSYFQLIGACALNLAPRLSKMASKNSKYGCTLGVLLH